MKRRGFTADDLLQCYRRGIFPMADSREDPTIYFVDPEERGIIPLGGLKISKSLAKIVRRGDFEVTYNAAFRQVMTECAAKTQDRPDTWINDGIKFLYGELHASGNAHSVEVWQNGSIVGGLYGVSIGGAFFGESMFSRVSNASKVALVHLVNRLNETGFVLLDTQFINPHLERMGAIEIPREDYLERLTAALEKPGNFTAGL